jgi:hypothetical protein
MVDGGVSVVTLVVVGGNVDVGIAVCSARVNVGSAAVVEVSGTSTGVAAHELRNRTAEKRTHREYGVNLTAVY